jgi:hypothetical protein
MKRHQQILAGLLVVQIILTVVVFWPKPAASGEATPLFPDVQVEDVTSLFVADDQGNEILLSREDGEWVMPEAGNYPTRSGSVTSVLSKTVQLESGNLVARTPASHDPLQVAEDNFVRKVVMETSGGDSHVLYVGSSPRYSATHVRLEGQDETYLVSGLSTYELTATPNTWVDTSYVSVDNAELVEVTLENEHGTVTFVPEGENAWTLADLSDDETADSTQIRTLVNRASRLSLKQPLGLTEEPEYGLEAPNATVTMVLSDTTETLVVGAHDEEAASYVVKYSGAAYYVTAAETAVGQLVDATRESFLQAEPTPTPTSSEQ